MSDGDLPNYYQRQEAADVRRPLEDLVAEVLLEEEGVDLDNLPHVTVPVFSSPEELEQLTQQTLQEVLAEDDPPTVFIRSYADLREAALGRVAQQRQAILDALVSAAGESPLKADVLRRELRQAYRQHRDTLYLALRDLGKILRVSDARRLAEKAVEHGIPLAAIREALGEMPGTDGMLLTDLRPYNTQDSGLTYGDDAVAFAYVNRARMACPCCGAFVPATPVDFGRGFHLHAHRIFRDLQGKLAQDCPRCSWVHFYDVDIATGMPDDYRLILSDPPFPVTKAESADGSKILVPPDLDSALQTLPQVLLLQVVSGPSASAFVSRVRSEVGKGDLTSSRDAGGRFVLSTDAFGFTEDTETPLSGFELRNWPVGGYLPLTVFRSRRPAAAGGTGPDAVEF